MFPAIGSIGILLRKADLKWTCYNKMKRLKILVTLLALSILSSCASITTGQNQSVSVNSHPHSGATCHLTNDKGKWYVTTPGSVTVTRSYSELTITCTKEDMHGTVAHKSSTKGMAFGNILLGGLIGAAVDMGTGSAYDYPTDITCPMQKTPETKQKKK